MTNTIQDLFAHNRAWAAEMIKQRPGFFTNLTQQQTPKYMWIGCSDSRVPANQITGLEPGEVFVHRNIANIVVHTDLNALSTIQFAVDVLHVQDIIVCGHYGCGGVLAALNNTRVGLADNWIRHIQDVRDKHHSMLMQIDASKRSDALVELNAIEQVINVCHSNVMQDAWQAGHPINVHGWVYGVHDGLLKDLSVSVSSNELLTDIYQSAIRKVFSQRQA